MYYARRHWAGIPGWFGRSPRRCDYDAFVPDPIAGAELTFSAPAVDAISQAEGALRDLQRSPELAGLESLSHQLLRTEAVASSRIEDPQLSHRRLARAIATVARGRGEPQARQAVLALEAAGVLRPVVAGRRPNRAWERPR